MASSKYMLDTIHKLSQFQNYTNRTREKRKTPFLLHLSACPPTGEQAKKGAKSKGDPPTTQAGTAVARSSRPRVASRARGARAAKIR